MRIAVFGLGYVGSVTSICLVKNGHEVWGVDEHSTKVDWLSRGIAPISEPEFGKGLTAALASGLFRPTQDARLAVVNTDAALVCVGTPSTEDGSTNLSAVLSVANAISRTLIENPRPYLVAIRSTIPPGTMDELICPIFENGARRLGADVRLCFNPEFLREGTALSDFFSPPFTVVGTGGSLKAKSILDDINRVYGLEGVMTLNLSFREAELLKMVCNAFHALKICFANEVGVLGAKMGADPIRLMEAFCQDNKLNISGKYLRPGMPFGGSCLPKDLRSLSHVAQRFGVKLPLIDSILSSNHAHIERAVAMLVDSQAGTVGIAGLVFKADTDDVRESPAVLIARQLLDAGRRVYIYDPEIRVENLVGANLAFLETHLPEFRRLLVSRDVLVANSDLIAATRDGLLQDPIGGKIEKPVLKLFVLHGEIRNS